MSVVKHPDGRITVGIITSKPKAQDKSKSAAKSIKKTASAKSKTE